MRTDWNIAISSCTRCGSRSSRWGERKMACRCQTVRFSTLESFSFKSNQRFVKQWRISVWIFCLLEFSKMAVWKVSYSWVGCFFCKPNLSSKALVSKFIFLLSVFFFFLLSVFFDFWPFVTFSVLFLLVDLLVFIFFSCRFC